MVIKGDTRSLDYSSYRDVTEASYGLFSKLWAHAGDRLYYGIQYLRVPKWDPNFGNYRYSPSVALV